LIQQGIYEFGPFVLDSAQMLLRRGGTVVPLQPRALETLLVLVKRRGEVVSKQQLIDAVWRDSFVEEGNLTQNIFLLRRELGKTPEGEEYIQTLPRRGYRFNAAVREIARNGSAGTATGSPALAAVDAKEEPARQAGGRRNWLFAAGHVLAMLLVLALGITAVGFWRVETAHPTVSGYVQITHDGKMKRGRSTLIGGPDAALFTDGRRIYLTEGAGNAPVIAEVSAEGGETAAIAVPFQLPQLLDVSRGRSELLVAASVNPVVAPPLWVVPVPAGDPRRLDDVSAWDASWSPDGREMVYISGADLYRAKSDGSEGRRLVTLPGLGWQPRWSPDGQTLRLTVFDMRTTVQSLWEVSREGTGLRQLLPDWIGEDTSGDELAGGPVDVCCGRWTPDGRFFVFQTTRGGRSEIWSMPGKPGLLGGLIRSIRAPVQVTHGQLSSLAPVFSPDGSKLFVIGQQLRGELQRFDARTGQFVPYLGGISADFVDFSRDGQWVAYVAFPEGTLWRSRIDGSERLQLTFPPMVAMVPKWSPDGSRIAFFGVGGGKQQRLYLIASNGGAVKPPSARGGGEMRPCWSPDGDSLMYSDFPFFSKEPRKVAIHVLHLKTEQVETLPGSEGYFAPSWSPDGRLVAAMALDGQRIMVFDFKTIAWNEVAKGWGLVRWSQDSQFLYVLKYGKKPAVARVRVSDRQVEEVASLRGVRLAGRLAGLDFSVTPDGAPLISRDIGTQEVYSLGWHIQ
jgi:DNA-binding winged helix-turn-helix (wHTH) protein/Tol biopolymer transport system component